MKNFYFKKKWLLKSIMCSIMVVLSCFGINVHGSVFAYSTEKVDELNTMSIDEIVSKEKFSSRDYDIVTPPIDQGTTQICWAYSTASASETSILKDRLDSNTKDTLRFSPKQIAYRTYNRDRDPLNNTAGVDANDKWNVTGSPYNTFLTLSQWCAPISYDVAAKADAYSNCMYRLLDAEKIDSNFVGQHKINEVKRAIAKYGAVTASYYNAREVEFYNTKGETLDGISHAINIIGWDDTIPASNFKPKTASRNGAWIIKNSYNSLPFFYLSYDSSIGNICGFKYANKAEFDYNYFYDNVIEEPMRSENNSKCVANIFMAQKSDYSHSEYVKAVNVATYGNNLVCDVKIYTNLANPSKPESGTLSATGQRELVYGGYHTIMLDKLAKIDKGTYYSVIVTVKSQNGGSAYILYSLNSSQNTKYKSASGWNSINYASRIKAYTVLKTDEPKTNISSAQSNNIANQYFTDQAICPTVQLTINSTVLEQGVDYTLSYKNNINVGTAEITVRGKGNYIGVLNIQFQILPIDVPLKPDNQMLIPNNLTTLSEVHLPTGWEWENPNLPVKNLTSATAIYTGNNKENYKNTTLLISLKADDPSKPNTPNENDNPNDQTISKENLLILLISLSSVTVAVFITLVSLLIRKSKQKRQGKPLL